jgi:hypothetical protein
MTTSQACVGVMGPGLSRAPRLSVCGWSKDLSTSRPVRKNAGETLRILWVSRGGWRMTTTGSDAPQSFGDWFRVRLKIIVDEPSASPERSTDPEQTARPFRQRWASLWSSIRQLLPGWAGGVSGPTADPLSGRTPTSRIRVEKLEGASKWAAGGFSAASALLLFFGVKEGVLDQAVRQNPFATLCVFMLLGVGVLSALFAGAIAPTVLIRLWAIVAAVAVMLLLTALFLPNLDIVRDVKGLLHEDSPGWLPAWLPEWTKKILFPLAWLPEWTRKILFPLIGLIVVGATVAIPLFFVRSRNAEGSQRVEDWVVVLVSAAILLAAGGLAIAHARMQTLLSVATGVIFLLVIAGSFAKEKATVPAIAGVIILGVAATSLGLYGAAKLSVGSKIFAVDPQVSASLEQADGQTVLNIVAVASRMQGQKLLITVTGVPRIGEVQPHDAMGATRGEIWQSVLEPNSIDEINTTITVPLASTRWEFVTVSHCRVDEERLDEGIKGCADQQGGGSLAVRARNLMPDVGAEITGHIVAASAKSLEVTLTGRGVAWGIQVQAEICRVRKGEHAQQLAYATLTPDATGAVTWDVPVPAGVDGDALVLRYRQCPLGSDCSHEDMARLAIYTLP